MLATSGGNHASVSSALGLDRRSLRKGEEPISMDFFDAAYALFMNDPDVQECISSIMHDCSQFGFVLSVDGKEVQLDRKAFIHIRDNFLDTAVRSCLFIYMISGFVFFARSKDRDGNAIPVVPPWGTGIITRQIRGAEVKYRYYTIRKIEGVRPQLEMVYNKNYFLKRYMVNVNGNTVEHDSILTSLIPLKFRSMFLLDSDAKTGRLLSRQIMMMEYVPEKEVKMLESEEKELANRWHMQRRGDWEAKRGPDDKSIRTELRDHLDRLHKEHAIREAEIEMELSTYSRYRSGRKGRSSPQELSRSISEGPVNFLMDRVTVEKGKKLVNPTLPSYRSDLLEHLKQIRTQFLDRLGYIPPSISINRPNRASIETRVIEKERRRALLPWSEVISRILTDMYIWTYHDHKHNASAAERMFRGDAELPAMLRRLKEEDEREYGLTLRFKDVVPLSVTEDFFQRGFIGAERFVHDVLEHSGISKPHIESYLRENAKHIQLSDKSRTLNSPTRDQGTGAGLSRYRRLSEASETDPSPRIDDDDDDVFHSRRKTPKRKSVSKPSERPIDERKTIPKKKEKVTPRKPKKKDSGSRDGKRKEVKVSSPSKDVVPTEEGASPGKSSDGGKDDDAKPVEKTKKRDRAKTEKSKEPTEKKKDVKKGDDFNSGTESDSEKSSAHTKKTVRRKKKRKTQSSQSDTDESDREKPDVRSKKPRSKDVKKRMVEEERYRTKSSSAFWREGTGEALWKDTDLFSREEPSTVVD